MPSTADHAGSAVGDDANRVALSKIYYDEMTGYTKRRIT